MIRSENPEIMDDPHMPEYCLRMFHSDLERLNKVLGNTKTILRRLKTGSSPVRSVLDIGCGQGGMLAEIRNALGAQVQGIDLNPPRQSPHSVEIVAADATKEPLPYADVAISVLTIHHLSPDEVVRLVQNVGKSCGRFVVLDLVRSPVPLALFSFLRPMLQQVVFLDGQQSIRRAYTPDELRALVVRGLAGTHSTFEQWVSLIHAKQIIDITYRA
ncbi:MAG: methyltransferase domain-containing protein [Acidobacteriota bacterium]|nr:methyltransferase domain-containing protein [Acidobacteriota bacterium]